MGEPRASRGLRIGVTFVLLAYLAAVWGNGFDRLSGISPPLERLVPAPFRAESDRIAAAVAMVRGEKGAALEAAARAVRADPVDPLSSALLGASRQLGGDHEGADAAFRVAGQFGWRVRLTQLYWYDVALRSGDAERAALRLDALLRAEPQSPMADMLLVPLEAQSQGRAALAGRLALRPDWIGTYFNAPPEMPAERLAPRVEVALGMAAQGARLGCEAPARFVNRLLQQGMRRDALAVWRAHCGDPGMGSGLADRDFARIAQPEASSPFGWRLHPSGDVAASFVRAAQGSGYRLNASNSGSISRLVLSQAVDLPPGRYRIRADVGADGQAAPGSVFASLDCGGSPRRLGRIAGDLARTGQTLDLGSCNGAVFGLWLRPGVEAEIGDIRIEKAD